MKLLETNGNCQLHAKYRLYIRLSQLIKKVKISFQLRVTF